MIFTLRVFLMLVLLGLPMLSGWATEDQLANRYEQMLLHRPREGTVLRNLYRHHIESMTLEDWLVDLESRKNAEPNDPSLVLVLGLAYWEHGEFDRARVAIQQAADLNSGDWYPPFCLGRLAFGNRDYGLAVTKFRDAMTGANVREDQLAVGEFLVRSQLHLGEADQAIVVADRLIATGGQDAQTIQGFAELFFEEGQAEVACRYYGQLRGASGQGPYERILAALRLAELEAVSGDRETALELYREALEEVNTDSWLYHEAWSKIETLFRRDDDLKGLRVFAQSWLEDHPDMVEVQLRLADVMIWDGLFKEALEIMVQARAQAPSRVDVLQRLVLVYGRLGRKEEAIKAMTQVVRKEPNRADHRIALGRLWWAHHEHPESKTKAEEWIVSLCDADPEDPALAVRAADELRDARLVEAAERYYRRAVAMSPEFLEHYEYLAEFLLDQGRRRQALLVFQEMAAGKRKTPDSLIRVAGRMAHHGYEVEAMDVFREAIAQSPDDFDAGIAFARYLERRGDDEASLEEWTRLEALAPNEFFRDEVVEARIRLLKSTRKLRSAYKALAERLGTTESPGDEERLLAARMALGFGDRMAARSWVEDLLDRPQPFSRALPFAERIYVGLGDMEGQIRILEHMIKHDPQQRGEGLRRLVEVYQRSGDMEEAIAVANRLIDVLPGNPTGHQTLARLHQRLGQGMESVEHMRKAIALAPSDISLRIELASLFRSQLMIPFAMETYWQAMDLAEDVSAQLAVVRPLGELYADQMRSDLFIERLKRRKNRSRDPLGPTLALVAAYEGQGDLRAARKELATLGDEFANDTDVLRRLVSLSRCDGDIKSAITYQMAVGEEEPSRRHFRLLGDLYLEQGDRRAALHAWQEGMRRYEDGPERKQTRVLEWVRRLQRNGFDEEALDVLSRLEEESCEDWHTMYRVAVAYMEAGKLLQAFSLFKRFVGRSESVTAPPPEVLSLDPSSLPAPTMGNDLPVHRELSNLSKARHSVYRSGGRNDNQIPVSLGHGPESFERAWANAIGYLALLKQELPLVGDWMEQLRHGSREELHVLLAIVYIIQETAVTRTIAREINESHPDDPFARLIMMTPGHAHLQHGMEDAFVVTVREQLAWFRQYAPSFEWYYNLHELRCLIYNQNQGEIRRVATRLVEHHANDPFVLAKSIQPLRQAKLYDLFERCIDGAVAYHESQGTFNMASRVVQSLGQTANQMVKEGVEPERALRVFGKYLDATQPIFRGGRRVGQGPGNIGVSGSRNSASNRPFPQPNYWWDSNRSRLLRQMYQACLAMGIEQLLIEFFQKRLAVAQGPDRITPGLALTCLNWWNGNPSASEGFMRGMLSEGNADDLLLLVLAHYHETVGEFKKALDILRGVKSIHGPVHKTARQWLLRLALDVGDDEAAEEAANHLLVMHLTPRELSDLSGQMLVMGWSEKANVLESRAARLKQSGEQSSQNTGFLAQDRLMRMRQLEEQGDLRRAFLIARQVIRSSGHHTQAKGSQARQTAFSFLKRVGKLDQLIEDTEILLRENPGQEHWIEELIALYREAGRHGDLQRLLDGPLNEQRNGTAIRMRYAKSLHEAKRYSDTADQLLVILDQAPWALFGPRGSQRFLIQVFTQADRVDELLHALQRVDPESFLRERRLLSSQGDHILANLISFSQEALNQEAMPPGISLQGCGLAEGLLELRPANDPVLARYFQIKGQSLEKLERHEEAFHLYLAGVVDGRFFEELGLSTPALLHRAPFHGMNWGREGVGALVLRCLHAAESSGRLSGIERVSRSRIREGDESFRFLWWAVLVEQGRYEEAEAEWEMSLQKEFCLGLHQNRAHHMVVQYAIAGRHLANHDQVVLAIGVWEMALDLISNQQGTGIGNNILRCIVDACVAIDQPERARDILRRRVPEDLHELLSEPPSLSRLSFQQSARAMEQLHKMGYSLDALQIAQTIINIPSQNHLEPFRQRALQLIMKIRKEGLPQRVREEDAPAFLASLWEVVEQDLSNILAWQRYLWAVEAAGVGDDAAEARRRMRAACPRHAEARLCLAESSTAAGADEEAIQDYMVALAVGPDKLFESPLGWRDMVAAFVRIDRKEALVTAMSELDINALVHAPGVRQPQIAKRVTNLIKCARYSMERDVPALGLQIAGTLRRALGHRTQFVTQRNNLAQIIHQATEQMNLNDQDAFVRLLPLVASGTVLASMGLESETVQPYSTWTMGIKWSEDRVEGLLDSILASAEYAGRLADWWTACNAAIAQGEYATHYLRALIGLRLNPDTVTEVDLDQATAAATVYRRGPVPRSLLLALLGQELLAANRPEDAVRAYTRGLQLANQAPNLENILPMIKALAESWIAAGHEDRARALLQEAVWPRSGTASSPQQGVNRKAAFHLAMAKMLHTFEFYDDAWLRAHAAANLFAGQPNQKHAKRAEKFVNDMLENDLVAMKRRGQFDRLLDHLHREGESSTLPGDSLVQTVRLLQADGRLSEAGTALRRLEELRPRDSDVKELLIVLSRELGDGEEVLRHAKQLLRIEPFRLLQDGHLMQTTLQGLYAEGTLSESAEFLQRWVLSENFPGENSDPDTEEVVMGLMQTATFYAGEAVNRSDLAIALLEALDGKMQRMPHIGSHHEQLLGMLIAFQDEAGNAADQVFRLRARKTLGAPLCRALEVGRAISSGPQLFTGLRWGDPVTVTGDIGWVIKEAGRRGALGKLIEAGRQAMEGKGIPGLYIVIQLAAMEAGLWDVVDIDAGRWISDARTMGGETSQHVRLLAFASQWLVDAGRTTEAKLLLDGAISVATEQKILHKEAEILFAQAQLLACSGRKGEAFNFLATLALPAEGGEHRKTIPDDGLAQFDFRVAEQFVEIERYDAALGVVRRALARGSSSTSQYHGRRFISLREEIVHKLLPELARGYPERFAALCEPMRQAVRAGNSAPGVAEDLYWCISGTADESELVALAEQVLANHSSATPLRIAMARQAIKRSFWTMAFSRYRELLRDDPWALFFEEAQYRDLATAAVRTDNVAPLVHHVEKFFPRLVVEGVAKKDVERALDQLIRLGRRLNHADLRQEDAAYNLLCHVGTWCHLQGAGYEQLRRRAEADAVEILAEGKVDEAYPEMVARLVPGPVATALDVPVLPGRGGNMTLWWSWSGHQIRCLLDSCLELAQQQDAFSALVEALRSVPEDHRADEWIWLTLIALRTGDSETAQTLWNPVQKTMADESRNLADRVRLHVYLGRKYAEAGRMDMGTSLLRKALDLIRNEPPTPSGICCILSLAEVLHLDGRPEKAVQLLMQLPWEEAMKQFDPPDSVVDIYLSILIKAAYQLDQWGFREFAINRARQILTYTTGNTRNYQQGKARELIEKITGKKEEETN